ncbi:FecCD family ABC transporter permease [Pengzhenrongella sicca]|uniref:Iron chelate uptake ABC transporter family permease subunit n=1 Tax=Pengzhenrongella sicca TaxID=2819238 RepID=A0A8A4ZE59_9MICO|nr:iron chelate uptake ABC transporter family permease subunit [Pengzhenrongella sicca]QTE27988.1 iron chelate uptake ABC transporter family permease subunit [Pengzhenrongella sicca]
MSSGRARRRALGLAVTLGFLAVLLLASLAVGSRPVPIASAWHALVHFDPTDDGQLIVRTLRLPRTLLGLLVGAALGAAGALMQALTRNPLADPGLLGINAGAAAVVVVAIGAFGVTDPAAYLWFALLGSAAAATAVYGLGGAFRRGASPVRLVLAGAAVAVVLAAFTGTVTVNYPDVFNLYRFWVVGSLQGRGFDVLAPTGALIVAGLVLAQGLSGSLNALALGADAGTALGVSVRRTWLLSAAGVVVLAGSATAAAGPISFIGLAAPHVARLVVGPDHRWVLPYSMLLGAVVLLGADVAGRVVALPSEVQTGVVSALIGAPLFVALVRRRRIATL